MFGQRFGTEPRKRNAGTGHGAVHISTAPSNGVCLERSEIPDWGRVEMAGKPLRGRTSVT